MKTWLMGLMVDILIFIICTEPRWWIAVKPATMFRKVLRTLRWTKCRSLIGTEWSKDKNLLRSPSTVIPWHRSPSPWFDLFVRPSSPAGSFPSITLSYLREYALCPNLVVYNKIGTWIRHHKRNIQRSLIKKWACLERGNPSKAQLLHARQLKTGVQILKTGTNWSARSISSIINPDPQQRHNNSDDWPENFAQPHIRPTVTGKPIKRRALFEAGFWYPQLPLRLPALWESGETAQQSVLHRAPRTQVPQLKHLVLFPQHKTENIFRMI